MKRYDVATAVICLAMLLVFGTVYSVWDQKPADAVLKVGFLYENDETTPYTYNFSLARDALEKELAGKVQVFVKSNVQESEIDEPVRELVKKGCAIIFTNTNTLRWQALAAEYPQVQFCQVSNSAAAGKDSPENYHTFNGKIYQGRYVSGIAAGMKLRALISEGVLRPWQAVVGFVGAFPTPEVISGFTAFFLGVRSVAPEAVMRVRYTGTWSNYTREKACARALIDEGCVIIAQHTSTVGPAAACEEAAAERIVFHVGYNRSVIEEAPTTSLISTRINWTPYIVGAARAVMEGKRIESSVAGDVHGTDISAGFDQGWVEMLELNHVIAAEGTADAVRQAVEQLRRGELTVFRGDYLGVNPLDETDTFDLNQGYAENAESSMPTFAYILQDVIQVEN